MSDYTEYLKLFSPDKRIRNKAKIKIARNYIKVAKMVLRKDDFKLAKFCIQQAKKEIKGVSV
jgi:hypothetical protein